MPKEHVQIKRTHFDINLFDHAKRRRWRTPAQNRHHRAAKQPTSARIRIRMQYAICNMQHAVCGMQWR